MKNIALTTAAILVATTGAFAGSDHFGDRAVNPTTVTIDNTYTASIRKPDMVRHSAQATMKSDADEPGQGIWGR